MRKVFNYENKLIFLPLNLKAKASQCWKCINAADILTNAFSFPILVAKYRVMPSVLNVTVCLNEIREIYLSPRVHRRARLGLRDISRAQITCCAPWRNYSTCLSLYKQFRIRWLDTGASQIPAIIQDLDRSLGDQI